MLSIVGNLVNPWPVFSRSQITSNHIAMGQTMTAPPQHCKSPCRAELMPGAVFYFTDSRRDRP